MGGLFCDLHKAFDCVNHEILLTKLEFYGISGISNKLIRSYLNDRYQRVEVTNTMHIKSTSSWELMKHGVPQGSVLGPLLFLIYINDPAHTLRKYRTPVLLADDTSIIISSTNENEFKNKLSFAINEMATWCKSNVLTLNLQKTKFMQFLTNHHKKIDMHITIMDQAIPNITSTKFLGLFLDNKLTWKAHSRELAIKLSKACYTIITIKPSMSLKVLNLYLLFILSFFFVVWCYILG